MRGLIRTGRGWPSATTALIALAVVASGCGSAGTATPAPTASPSPVVTAAPTPTVAPTALATATPDALPSGWTRTSVAADGYSIGTPGDWSPTALGGKDIDALIADFKTTNPELAGILQQARDANQSFSFVAITTDPALIGDTGFAPNVNVVITDSQGYDASYIATANVIALKRLTSVQGDIVDTAVALPADPGAHRLRYHLKFSASLTTAATLFVLTRGSKAYNITVSAVDSQLPGLEASIATMAQSFAFIAP